nr:sugar kinase [Streptomyces liangshanensis]
MTGVTGPVPPRVDVVCLGESMVTFLPSRPGRLADVPSFDRAIGGAESNVACALAAAGHAVKWVSRVGADGFGDHLVAAVGAYGVDTSGVRRDPDRPTGVYFRTATDRATDAHEVAYYRAGSAASAMSPATVPYRDLWAGRVLHLSGITAALSADCLALMRELTRRRPGRPLVSFDVNHRPGLWRDGSGADVLLELARGADLVFVGDDEAAQAWGLRGADAIRAALPEPRTLVVKRGSAGATVLTREGSDGARDSGDDTGSAPAQSTQDAPAPDTVTDMPALHVDVVAPVGAGDAFAAGFLSATLRGLPAAARLRHGHLMAAATLTVPGDLGTPPTRADADRLAGLDARAWGRLRLGPGWTAAIEQEVRTR